MSYNTYPNYLYGANGQANQSRYGGNQDSLLTSETQRTQSHTGQLVQQPQNAPSSTTSGWPTQSRSASTYAGASGSLMNSWPDPQNLSHDYYRQASPYTTPESGAAVGVTHRTDTHDTPNRRTEGLNHLAYASGLQASNSYSGPATSRTPEVIPPKAIPSTRLPARQDQTKSPVDYQFSRNQLQVAQPMHERSDSNSSRQMAVSAAAALASAANNRFGASYQSHFKPTPQRVLSPDQAQAPAGSLQQNSANPKSPATMKHSASASVQSSNTSRPPQQSTYTTTSIASNVDNNFSRPSMQSHAPRDQPMTGQQTNSIANLVIPDNVIQKLGSDQPVVSEQVSGFINPAQIFNPYHLEHERKKREAAEAEAEAKRKAVLAEQADARRRAEEEAREKQAETARRAQEAATANSKTKVRKKPFVGTSQTTQTFNPPTPANSTPDEQRMATEMKVMLERMKEFRSKDPSLFQKLWNDMRVPATSAVSPSAQAGIRTSTPPRIAQEKSSAQATGSSDIAIQTSQATQLNTATRLKEIPEAARGESVDRSRLPAYIPANGFKVVVENNPENLPDRGRFPAERRIRLAYKPKDKLTPLNAQANRSENTTQTTAVVGSVEADSAMQQSIESAGDSHEKSKSGIWPAARRAMVARAALQHLKSLPDNTSVVITIVDIESMLNKNPTYATLCDMLVERGLKFDRTSLAQNLVEKVPELRGPQPHRAEVQTPRSQDIPPNSVAYRTTDSQASAAPTQGLPQSALPITPASTFVAAISNVQRKAEAVSSMVQSAFAPTPSTKEYAARKRAFEELIDSTQLAASEELYVLPAKKPRTERELVVPIASANQSWQRTGLGSGSSAQPLDNSQSTSVPLRFQTQAPFTASTNRSASDLGDQAALRQHRWGLSFLQPSPLQPDHVYLPATQPLAQKMTVEEAFAKKYYDPRTVARDILITSGKHPFERPLNEHLLYMLGTHFDRESNLSTFDWDAIDPGGPPVPVIPRIDLKCIIPKTRVDEKRRRRAPSRVEEGSRSTPRPHQSVKPGASEVDPQITRRSKPLHKTTSSVLNEQRTTASQTHESRHQSSISVDIGKTSSSQASPSTRRQSQSSVQQTEVGGRQRRGRPPGAKNKQPSQAAMKKAASAIVVNVPPADSLPPVVLHNYKCKWIKCTAQLHNLETLRRHVGKCHALSASETGGAGYVCWWKRCEYLAMQDDGSIAPSHTFDGKTDWMQHVVDDHIYPIGLKFGNGPSTTHTDPQRLQCDRNKFLRDSDGRITTPELSIDGEPDLPADVLELFQAPKPGPRAMNEGLKAQREAERMFIKAHGGKAQDQRRHAEEVVRAMEVRKQRIGPGIDRGGCTLINEARRATFLHAPDIARFIEADF